MGKVWGDRDLHHDRDRDRRMISSGDLSLLSY